MGIFHIHKWDKNCNCIKCKKSLHKWSEWKYLDDEWHTRTCMRCQKFQKEPHIFESNMIKSSKNEIECSRKTCDRCGHTKPGQTITPD